MILVSEVLNEIFHLDVMSDLLKDDDEDEDDEDNE
jgi:hypothetical protein